jgi:hypothetical protein
MESPAELIGLMDASNIESMVDLNWGWGSELEDNLERYDRAHPGRFFTFCHIDWRLLGQRNGPDRLARSLKRSVAKDARELDLPADVLEAVYRANAMRPLAPGDPPHAGQDKPPLDAPTSSSGAG